MHAHQPLPPALGADQAARRRATCSHAIKDRPGQTRVGENTRVRTRSGERAYLLLLLLLLFFFIFFDQGNHHAWPTSSISILEPPTSAAPQQARRSCGRRTCKSHAPPRLFTPDALLVSAAPPPHRRHTTVSDLSHISVERQPQFHCSHRRCSRQRLRWWQRPQKSPSALEPCKCSSSSRHQQASRRCGRRTRYIARTSVGVHPRGKRWWWSRKYDFNNDGALRASFFAHYKSAWRKTTINGRWP